MGASKVPSSKPNFWRITKVQGIANLPEIPRQEINKACVALKEYLLRVPEIIRLFLVKFECGGIDAVAKPSGVRTVVEDVA